MVYHIILFFFSIFIVNIVSAKEHGSIKIALLDAVGREQELYAPFIDSARAVGIAMDYFPADQLFQSDVSKRLNNYRGILLIAGKEFLQQMKRSMLCRSLVESCRIFSQQQDRIVGVVIPAIPLSSGMEEGIMPLFSILGCDGHSEEHAFVRKATTVLAGAALDFRHIPYDTTLRLPSSMVVNNTAQLYKTFDSIEHQSLMLPANRCIAQNMDITLPYGLYWYNRSSKNHSVALLLSAVTSCSIAEIFHNCPIDSELKKMMNTALMQLLAELRVLVKNNDSLDDKKVRVLKKIEAPIDRSTFIPLLGSEHKTPAAEKKQQIAWMEIILFEPYKQDAKKSDAENGAAEKDQKIRQDQFVDDIFDAGLDSLWLSITPNIYYSTIGRMVTGGNASKAQENEERFLSSVSLFTQKLQEKAQARKQAPPAIVLGFEVANNLYPPNLAPVAAFDMFGNRYFDVPGPLFKSFWDQEIVAPLDKFLEKWNDPVISNGLPISGIMIDLEMYNRKTTGVYPSLVGFEQSTLRRYGQHKKLAQFPGNRQGQIEFLVAQNLLPAYYKFLEQGAQQLGNYLGKHFYKKLPDCQIMCYLPNILTSWFYKGLYKGLAGAGEKPLYLLTFNSEYEAHRAWFVKNRLDVRHLCVLLLSKIKKPEDVSLVYQIMNTHDGVWYNRFSRFAEDYNPASWTHIEQSPMSSADRKAFFARLIEGKSCAWKQSH